jgi:excinuclease ABC subunit B
MGIVPRTVLREIGASLGDLLGGDGGGEARRGGGRASAARASDAATSAAQLPALIDELRREMKKAAAALEFERAAELRDRVRALEAAALAGLPGGVSAD